jgi:hypothetical protein
VLEVTNNLPGWIILFTRYSRKMQERLCLDLSRTLAHEHAELLFIHPSIVLFPPSKSSSTTWVRSKILSVRAAKILVHLLGDQQKHMPERDWTGIY